ncbi:hypothetical protein ACVWZ6_002566 [Bradyrhizobium sp. GM6.1]
MICGFHQACIAAVIPYVTECERRHDCESGRQPTAASGNSACGIAELRRAQVYEVFLMIVAEDVLAGARWKIVGRKVN